MLKEDVQNFVKKALANPAPASVRWFRYRSEVADFSKFGPVTEKDVQVASRDGRQHDQILVEYAGGDSVDEVDITDLELSAKRKAAAMAGVKLPFLD